MFIRTSSLIFMLGFFALSGFSQTTTKCDTMVHIYTNYCVQGKTLPYQREYYFVNSKKIETRMVFLDYKGLANYQIYYKNQKLKESIYYGSASKVVKETVQSLDDPPRIVYLYKPKRNGDYRTWYENGNLNTHGQYTNNEPTGTWKHYYSSGRLEREGSYESADKNYPPDRWEYYSIFSYPKKIGPWILYYENGNYKEKVSFKNNLRIGTSEEYYDNGNLLGKGTYQIMEGMVPDTILVTSPVTLEETW